MRGTPDPQLTMLSTLSPESLITADHPIRRIKRVVEAVLAEMGPEFDAIQRDRVVREDPANAGHFGQYDRPHRALGCPGH